MDFLSALIELITMLHKMQTRSIDENSVYLPVRLSVCQMREL